MNLFRPLTLFVLAISLLISGGVTSYGKALSAGGQTLLICSDLGERTALIGANGEELPQLHLCDECCLAIAMQPPAAWGQSPLIQTTPRAYLPIAPLPVLMPRVMIKPARGPPVIG